MVVKEFEDGNFFADDNDMDELQGIEVFAPFTWSVLDIIVDKPPAKRFLRKAIPRGMVAAR